MAGKLRGVHAQELDEAQSLLLLEASILEACEELFKGGFVPQRAKAPQKRLGGDLVILVLGEAAQELKLARGGLGGDFAGQAKALGAATIVDPAQGLAVKGACVGETGGEADGFEAYLRVLVIHEGEQGVAGDREVEVKKVGEQVTADDDVLVEKSVDQGLVNVFGQVDYGAGPEDFHRVFDRDHGGNGSRGGSAQLDIVVADESQDGYDGLQRGTAVPLHDGDQGGASHTHGGVAERLDNRGSGGATLVFAQEHNGPGAQLGVVRFEVCQGALDGGLLLGGELGLGQQAGGEEVARDGLGVALGVQRKRGAGSGGTEQEGCDGVSKAHQFRPARRRSIHSMPMASARIIA